MSESNQYIISSVESYRRFGITPSNLRFMVNNLFYMPQEYKDCLAVYFLDKEDTEAFLSSIRDGMYQIGATTRAYQIIYHKTDPTKLLRRKEHTSVKLSFRVADPIFNIMPTVLVMEIVE